METTLPGGEAPVSHLTESSPRPRRRSLARRAASAVTLFLVLVAAFLGYIGVFGGNFRTVIPGRLYRSAQLSPSQLDRVIREHGIRTVISLRGGEMSDAWFRAEHAVCESHGAALESISLSATRLPPPNKIRQLFQVLDRAQFPILIHCRGGADRTGLGVSLFLNAYEKLPLKQATSRGLTWHYGHIPISTAAMDRFFEMYQRDGEKTDLRTWALTDYPREFAEAKRRR